MALGAPSSLDAPFEQSRSGRFSSDVKVLIPIQQHMQKRFGKQLWKFRRIWIYQLLLVGFHCNAQKDFFDTEFGI
jgi:hypothetical protein